MFDPDDYELHEAQKHACKMARERDAALSRRGPSHDGLCGNGNYNERTDK